MLMNHIGRKNWTGNRGWVRRGFLLGAPARSLSARAQAGLAGGLAALVLALAPSLYAQSPLTVQPSTGRVGVGNTNPQYPLDVSGAVHAQGGFVGDGSQLMNLPVGGGGDTANV